MKTATKTYRVLVIGGRGYIGRHIAKHLNDLGAEVIIGTRALHRNIAANERVIALHKMHDYQAWLDAIDGVDCVINTVGILRQRFGESYEQVHHHAVAKLASACQTKDSKLIHISALGLQSDVRSRFMHSKLDGEAALLVYCPPIYRRRLGRIRRKMVSASRTMADSSSACKCAWPSCTDRRQ